MAVEGNVGLAFGLVIAAGLCTCLGATMVFCTNVANHKVLSGALGASAGVMTYVSFVEIFGAKAIAAFVEAGLTDNEAARYATFAFFTGVITTWLLGKFTHCLAHVAVSVRKRKERPAVAPKLPDTNSPAPTSFSINMNPKTAPPATVPTTATPVDKLSIATTAKESAGDVEQGVTGADHKTDTQTVVKDAQQGMSVRTTPPVAAAMVGGPGALSDTSSSMGDGVCDFCDDSRPVAPLEIPKEENPEIVAVLQADHHTTDLARMGLLTGLAVGLHNVPEGLATFVATLASPSAGVAIAVAIALHNIPEGVVVAMPIYYATKSKWKGFLWSFVSGVAEPIGGLLAYLILASNGMSPLAFAIMFAFVAGMMVYISMRELLPTALRYDPKDTYATSACLWGMVVMAASLLLFKV